MRVDTETIAWSLVITGGLTALGSWCMLRWSGITAISFIQLVQIEILAGLSGFLCLGAYSVPSKTREINRSRKRLTRIIEAGKLEIPTRRQLQTKAWDWVMLITCFIGVFLGGYILYLEHKLLSTTGNSIAVRLSLAGFFFAGGGGARAIIAHAVKGHLKGLERVHQQACAQIAEKISGSSSTRPA